MLNCLKSKTVLAGLAMFSMFFGAGNIIFPLAIGHYAQDQVLFAVLGLLITAVIVPFSGLIGMILFDGNSEAFFETVGKKTGFTIELLIMLLLGPLGSTPRCIALANTTFQSCFSTPMPAWIFCGMGAALVFLLAYRKTKMLDLLGYLLTPFLLLSLLVIIVVGILSPFEAIPNPNIQDNVFIHGLLEGYNTMDLLAAFFFSSMVVFSLKQMISKEQNLAAVAIKASMIGASLLAIVYIGFSYVASLHAHTLSIQGPDQLLGALTMKLLGSSAGMVVSIAVGLACLTTAIALSSVFAEFLRSRVLKEKMSYEMALFLTLLVTYFVSIFEFSGISRFLGPVLQLCYPALIMLTILNIVHKLTAMRPTKGPIYATFGVTLLARLLT